MNETEVDSLERLPTEVNILGKSRSMYNFLLALKDKFMYIAPNENYLDDFNNVARIFII